jgi:hypothetical protein
MRSTKRSSRPEAATRPRAGATRPAKGRALSAVFEGTCRLDIPDTPTPPPRDAYPLRCGILFSAARDAVSLTDFQTVTTDPYAADLGPLRITNTTTVHLRSSREGRMSADGHISIDVVLHFDHSFDAPFVEEDSDLPVTLSTKRRGGARLDRQGRVTLVGEGRFAGGALDGKRCVLTYRGRVSPPPW